MGALTIAYQGTLFFFFLPAILNVWSQFFFAFRLVSVVSIASCYLRLI